MPCFYKKDRKALLILILFRRKCEPWLLQKSLNETCKIYVSLGQLNKDTFFVDARFYYTLC